MSYADECLKCEAAGYCGHCGPDSEACVRKPEPEPEPELDWNCPCCGLPRDPLDHSSCQGCGWQV